MKMLRALTGTCYVLLWLVLCWKAVSSGATSELLIVMPIAGAIALAGRKGREVRLRPSFLLIIACIVLWCIYVPVGQS